MKQPRRTGPREPFLGRLKQFPPQPTRACPRCGQRVAGRGILARQGTIGELTVQTFADDAGLEVFSILRNGVRIFDSPTARAGSVRVGTVWGLEGYTGADLARARSLPSPRRRGLDDPWLLGRVRNASRWLKPGADLTGDGQANLVVLVNTPGNHCCRYMWLFALAPRFRLLGTLDLGHELTDGAAGDERFVDLDQDGFPEIETRDWTFAGWRTQVSQSPAPRVVLKWRRGRFRVAPGLMRGPPPGAAELRRRAAAFRRSPVWEHGYVPHELWGRVLDLAYTGHSGAARRLLHLAWPKWVAKRKWGFLASFRRQLKKSRFWPAVAKANGTI